MQTIERLRDLGFARPFDQVGIVVPDLMASVRAYSAMLGVGPWVGWRYDGAFLGWREYRGGPGRYSMQLTVAGESPQLELLEPLEGPSVFSEFLGSHGPGVHHVAYFVPSLADAAGSLAERGFVMVQSAGGHGLDGDGAFGYFDTTAALGLYLECIELPRQRRPPHFTYPAPEGEA